MSVQIAPRKHVSIFFLYGRKALSCWGWLLIRDLVGAGNSAYEWEEVQDYCNNAPSFSHLKRCWQLPCCLERRALQTCQSASGLHEAHLLQGKTLF